MEITNKWSGRLQGAAHLTVGLNEMWKELIENLTTKCEFFPPVARERFRKISDSLSIDLPDDLIELLAESNGVNGEHGLGLIWSVERIIEDNLQFRSNAEYRDLYMPFDHLLFFADAGNGDQFAYSINAGKICRNDIYAWNHEDDSRTWVAPSLSKYLEWWLTGEINL